MPWVPPMLSLAARAQALDVDYLSGPCLAALAATPHLLALTSLTLHRCALGGGGDNAGGGVDGLDLLLAAPWMQHLRRLRLCEPLPTPRRASDGAFAGVALPCLEELMLHGLLLACDARERGVAGAALPALRRLDVGHSVDDEWIEQQLAHAPWAPQLTHLQISGFYDNEPCGEDGKALLLAPLSSLRLLGVYGQFGTFATLRPLAAAAGSGGGGGGNCNSARWSPAQLTCLRLQGTEDFSKRWRKDWALFAAAPLHALREFDCEIYCMEPEDARALGGAVWLPQLTRLHFTVDNEWAEAAHDALSQASPHAARLLEMPLWSDSEDEEAAYYY